jgi:hypothetical protein
LISIQDSGFSIQDSGFRIQVRIPMMELSNFGVLSNLESFIIGMRLNAEC